MPAEGVKDKGYAWLVFAAILLSQFTNGSATFGIISVLSYIWTDVYGINTEKVAWGGAVMSASLFLTGPMLSLVIKAIGTWKTQLLGVVLSIAGSLITVFSTRYWQVLIGFSFIQALGFAMTLLASADIVALYFHKHRDKVYSAANLSWCVGMLVSPIITEYLMDVITYKNTVLFMTVLCSLNLPSAFIFRKFSCCDKAEASEPESDPVDCELHDIKENKEVQHPLMPLETKITETENSPAEAYVSNQEADQMIPPSSSTSNQDNVNDNVNIAEPMTSKALRTEIFDFSKGNKPKQFFAPFSRRKSHSVEISAGKMCNQTAMRIFHSPNVKSLSPEDEKFIHTQVTSSDGKSDSKWKAIKSVLAQHWIILKQPLFVMVLAYYFLVGVGNNSFYTLAVEYVVGTGEITFREAAIGMTISGVSQLISSVVLTICSNWVFDRYIVCINAALVCGLGMMLIPIAYNANGVYVLMLVFGLGDSVIFVNMMPFLFQLFPGPPDQVTIRLSYNFFSYGLGSLSGPIIAGHIASVSGKDSMFYFMGVCSIGGGVMMFLYWVVYKFKASATE